MAAYDNKKSQLTVQVADEGRGIESDQMGKLFKFLSQCETTNTRTRTAAPTSEGSQQRVGFEDMEGVGMGLFLCKNILKAYNEDIVVFSGGQNQGSTFQFTMKMKIVKQES